MKNIKYNRLWIRLFILLLVIFIGELIDETTDFFLEGPIWDIVLDFCIIFLLILPVGYKILTKMDVINKKLETEVHEHKKTALELIKSESELRNIFDKLDTAIWSWDATKNKTLVSKGCEKIFGYSQSDFSNNPLLWKEIIYPEDKKIGDQIVNALHTGKSIKYEYRIIRPDGTIRWVLEQGIPILDDKKKVVNIYGTVFDITEQKEFEQQMQYMAFHDALTGLPNRYMLNNYLQKSISRCKRNNKMLAVMFLDLDRFKFINDTKGHEIGDIFLKQVAKKLVKNVREEDFVTRQGGDEFIIIIEDIDESYVVEVAKRICTSINSPFNLNGDDFHTTTSIGISLFPKDGENYETLIKHADTAMYLAKQKGKNNYQFFIPESGAIIKRKRKLESELQKALQNNEFILHYQPQVELETREIKAVEALLRWNHPEIGLVSPIEFIPIAEELGLIVTIGKWVLKTACKQMIKWQKEGIFIRVAINVSPIQFHDMQFIETIKKILTENKLEPCFLELEITESVMQNVEVSYDILVALRKMGIKISIDDFGTGYSSLHVLHNLPIDYVKIDKSFIRDMLKDSNSASLVNSIIQMGANLNFELIAEGIETEQQALFLSESGCRYGQGYLYSPPLPAEDVKLLLLKQKIRT